MLDNLALNVRALADQLADGSLAAVLPIENRLRGASMRRIPLAPDWSTWTITLIVVLLICGLLLYWLSLEAT